MAERSRPEDAAQYITVSDPVQHVEGIGNKYTAYRVEVRGGPGTTPEGTDDPSSAASSVLFQNPGYSAVMRRYNDFRWLYENLQREMAGAIVPWLPEKQAVGRYSAEFIENRRFYLERFLRRVAVHPELAEAQSLQTFLKADDATFHSVKHSRWAGGPGGTDDGGYGYGGGGGGPGSVVASMAPPPAAPEGGLVSWAAGLAGAVMGPPALVNSPDDDLFAEMESYVNGLESQMKVISQHATTLVRKGKEMANGLFEFGLAFSLLSQSEEGVLGQSLKKMGDVSDQLSILMADHAEKEGSGLEDPILDYIRMIQEVKVALRSRQEKRRTYSSALADLSHKEQQAMKFKGVMGKEQKSYEADMALRRAKEDCQKARDLFATVSQRVLREVDRFKREKADDMRRTVMDYIDLQIDYNQKMERIWADLIPKLEQVSLDESNEGAVSETARLSAGN